MSINQTWPGATSHEAIGCVEIRADGSSRLVTSQLLVGIRDPSPSPDCVWRRCFSRGTESVTSGITKFLSRESSR